MSLEINGQPTTNYIVRRNNSSRDTSQASSPNASGDMVYEVSSSLERQLELASDKKNNNSNTIKSK